jgi:hypothetical protein
MLYSRKKLALSPEVLGSIAIAKCFASLTLVTITWFRSLVKLYFYSREKYTIFIINLSGVK